MIAWIKSWMRDRTARRVVRRAITDIKALQAEHLEELEKHRGKWRCYSCTWIGEAPVAGSELWQLENVRGFTPKRLEQLASCPECHEHTAYLVGDPGMPIPGDFPMEEFRSQGPCPSCGSEDTIPIIRGYPSNKSMLAASMGRAKLGGCVIIKDAEGNDPPSRSCKRCGREWY